MQIKICGIQTPEIVETCIKAGADLIGFAHFEKSPRHLSFDAAKQLRDLARNRVQTVVFLVNPDDELIDQTTQIVAPDWIQLHGSETPARVTQIAARTKSKILKVIPVRTHTDLADISTYCGVSDAILLEAKPSPDAILPGGNGESFDWDILTGEQNLPDFFLAGGLGLDNVARAVAQVRPFGIDVSSGVESSRGVKDAQMIEQFIAKARAAEHADK